MIIDPSEYDHDKYCTRYGYATRLDGTIAVTPHRWGKWRRGGEEWTRDRDCVICGLTERRPTRDKRFWPAKPAKRHIAGENVVSLEEYRAS